MRLLLSIGETRFPPPAVRVLFGDEPDDRATDILRLHVFTDRLETGQHRPCAVNIVHAPPPVPRAILFLRLPEKSQSTLRCRRRCSAWRASTPHPVAWRSAEDRAPASRSSTARSRPQPYHRCRGNIH